MSVKKVINDRQRARKVYGFVRRLPDLVSLQQVESDASVLTLDWKESVRCASTINISLPPGSVTGPVDGVTLSDGDRLLLKNQTTSSENGIYVVNTATSDWTRASDAIPGDTMTCGATTYVEDGTTNEGSKWMLSTKNVTLGGAQTWILFDRGNDWLVSGSGGQMKTADKVSIGADYPTALGSDIFFFVSGSMDGTDRSVFGGDVYVSGSLLMSSSIVPVNDMLINLGSETKRWANIYTGDLHLKNDRGNWTIVEEQEHLTVRNNKTNKLYKFIIEPLDDNK